MSLAQVSDILFLVLLPLMLKSFGYKKTIFIGILAWAVRYFLLAGSVDSASFQTTFVFAAILLHGVCYDFLFIAGQLYVDEEANERIRGAAQGLIAFILWGSRSICWNPSCRHIPGEVHLNKFNGKYAARLAGHLDISCLGSIGRTSDLLDIFPKSLKNICITRDCRA